MREGREAVDRGPGPEVRDLIRSRRLTLGLTQAELAERVEMSPEWVTKIEQGRFNPSLDAMRRLAPVLGVEFEAPLTASGLTRERLEAAKLARALPPKRLDRWLRRVIDTWPHLSPAAREYLVRTVDLLEREVPSGFGGDGASRGVPGGGGEAE